MKPQAIDTFQYKNPASLMGLFMTVVYLSLKHVSQPILDTSKSLLRPPNAPLRQQNFPFFTVEEMRQTAFFFF